MGDCVGWGNSYGGVRALRNDQGQVIEEAAPGMPVEVLGFDSIPDAGDLFAVVEDEKTSRDLAAQRLEKKRDEETQERRRVNLENFLQQAGSPEEEATLNIVLKADTHGSLEALRGSLGREEATGRGVMVITREACRAFGIDICGARVAVQGFGNVGSWTSKLIAKLGAHIVAVSDVNGGIFCEGGLDMDKLAEHVASTGTVSDFAGSTKITNHELLSLKVDVLIPAALGGAITRANVGDIKAKLVVEAANSPKQLQFGRDKSEKLPGSCRGCRFRFICNGACPKDRFLRTPEGEPGLNYLCRGYKTFFAHVDPTMKAMAAEIRAGRPAAGVMRRRRAEKQRAREASAANGPVRRNAPCPCGSGRKFKNCCMRA